MSESDSEQNELPVSDRSTQSRRVWCFRLAAIVLGCTVLLVLEVGLRLFDIARPGGLDDPFVGFSAVYPLFEADADGELLRTARSRQLFFGEQQFAREKPVGTRRVFVLGGSTVRGRPYETHTAFPQWLRIELELKYPDTDFEVINCGGLSYASYRLVPILNEVQQYEPDLIVVACGHNEFLEDRTYRNVKRRGRWRIWWDEQLHALRLMSVARHGLDLVGVTDRKRTTTLDAEVTARLDEASGYASYQRDERWRRQVVEHFGDALTRMSRLCRAADVPLVFVQLGSNLRDCPPFKSQHRDDLNAEDERTWLQAFARAESLESRDAERALLAYREAEAIDDRHALLLFRIARALDQMGETAAAREYYLRSKEEDVCPLRILQRQAEVLKRVADETDELLIDVATDLDTADTAAPGFDWYVDHVHPTLHGHQTIARSIAAGLTDRVQSRLELQRPIAVSRSRRMQAYAGYWAGLPPTYFADASRRVAWLENWARRQRLYVETLPTTPAGYLRHGYRNHEFGMDESGAELWAVALRDDRQGSHRQILDWSAEFLAEGRVDSAKWCLSQLTGGLPPESGSEIQYAGDVISEFEATGALPTADLLPEALPTPSRWRDLIENAESAH